MCLETDLNHIKNMFIENNSKHSLYRLQRVSGVWNNRLENYWAGKVMRLI